MNTINERISYLIDRENLKKIQFAERVGLSQAYVSQICSGIRTPSDRLIADICREFNIRREWLENGEEPMRHPEPDADMAYLNALLASDDAETIRFIKKFLRTYTTLPAEDQRVIDNLIHTLLNQK